jgi:lycopene cyclase domain-containing protein
MTGPTYLEFHLVFLAPAVALMAVTSVVSRPWRRVHDIDCVGADRSYWVGVVVVTFLALAYTTPWDNYLIATGVWSYGEGSTLARLGYAPIEEYAFIVLQPVLTALWLSPLSLPEWPTPTHPRRSRAVATGLALALGAVGWWLLWSATTFYLGAILAWAAPVLALQWTVGAPQLWANRRLVALGTLVPTLYLSIIDRIAIEYGIWTLSPRYTTGVEIGGLPVEEALFFLVTNLFVVQGLVLYRWVLDRRRPTDAVESGSE